MESKKKMGRPSQGKVWKSFTADKEVADFLESLPDGQRSQFVNEAVAMRIAEMKVQQDFIDRLKGENHE